MTLVFPRRLLRMRRLSRPVLAGLVLLAGCSLNSKPERPAVMASTNVTAPVEALRSAVLGQSQQASDEIERAADTIAATTTSQSVRVNTLEWKLVSTTSLQSAALARDPTVALADLIIFTLQLQDYLTTGQGQDLFDDQQETAVLAVETNLRRMLRLVDAIAPAGASSRWMALLTPLAAAHPIQSPMVGRASVSDSLLEQLSTDRSALAAVGDIEVTTRLLDRRIEQMQRNLLKQARWQAELMMADVAKQPVMDTLMLALTRTTTAVDRITGVAEGIPELVTSERLAVLRAVTQERMALLTAVSAERDSLLAGIHAERVGTLVDAEAMTQRLVDYAFDRSFIDVIDRVLWRIFFGVLILGLLGFVAGLVLVRVSRRTA